MPLRPARASLFLGRLSPVARAPSPSNLLPQSLSVAGSSSSSSAANSAVVLPRSSLIARSSAPHHRCQQQQQQLRAYSTSRPSPSPHNDRSQFKVLPFVVILAIGSGSYVLLVKSRVAARQQQQQQQQE